MSALLRSKGTGNAGRAMRPQPRVQNKKAHEHSHHGHTGSPGIPRAMVLTAYIALSPGTGLFCPRRFRELCPRKLDTSVGVSGPHDFAVRIRRASSLRAISVHRIPPHVRDDRETPLMWDGTKSVYFCFYPGVKQDFGISEVLLDAEVEAEIYRFGPAPL